MKTASDEFITKETATERAPAELFHFWRDGGDDVYFTSGDIEIEYSENTYVPVAIKRGAVEYNSSLEVSTMEITIAITEYPLPEYLRENPVEIIWMEVIKIFRDQDPIEGGSIFLGQIKSVTVNGTQAQVSCVGFEFFLKQLVPKEIYGVVCNWTLFDSRCSLDESSYKITAIIESVSADGLTLISADFAEKADDFFTNGDLLLEERRRMIVSHVGDTIKIRYPIFNLVEGAEVEVCAGCDGDVRTCRDKFSNVINFGGHPYIPLDNPVTWM